MTFLGVLGAQRMTLPGVPKVQGAQMIVPGYKSTVDSPRGPRGIEDDISRGQCR